MKKNVKSNLIFAGIILLVLVILFFPKSTPETDLEVVQCIGENSILYGQLGCHYCEDQEELFGNNFQYINKIDCFYETDKCEDITGTPTWKINGEYHSGVKTIKELQELTGC